MLTGKAQRVVVLHSTGAMRKLQFKVVTLRWIMRQLETQKVKLAIRFRATRGFFSVVNFVARPGCIITSRQIRNSPLAKPIVTLWTITALVGPDEKGNCSLGKEVVYPLYVLRG